MLEQFLIDNLDITGDKDILLMGDLNARLGDWSNGEEKYDEYGEIQGDGEDYFIRKSQDNRINGNGKKIIELCKTFDLTPVHGLVDRNFDDNFTFIAPQGNSVVDHFVCSTLLMNRTTRTRTRILLTKCFCTGICLGMAA